MKFITKPKCKRDIKAWRSYRRWALGKKEIWWIAVDVEFPYKRKDND